MPDLFKIYKEIGMRKNKKLLGIALVPCMVGSLLAGCTASSEDTDATPVSTEAEQTTAEAGEETAKAPVDEGKETTKAPETDGETEPETKDDTQGGQGTAFIDVLKGVSDMESYRMNTSVVVNQKTGTDGTKVAFNIEALTDGKGNTSITIGADFDEEDVISLHGNLFTISKVDDRIYLDMTNLYDTMMETLGDESQVIEQYAAAFEVSMDEVESLLVLGIPVGNLDFSKADYAKLQDAMNLVYDDMAAAIDSLGEDFLTQDGNTYTITIDNDNLIDAAEAILAAFEGNMGDIYDAYVDGMKNADYSVYMEAILKTVVDEVIEGIENASETELDEDMRAELEAEIQSAVEEYKTSMEEAVAELENGKDEFMDEFSAAVKEFKDSEEDIQAAIDGGTGSIKAVMDVTAEGEKGSRKVTSQMTVNAEDLAVEDAEASAVSIILKSTIEEGDVEITAPEEYAPLSKAIEIAYRVYTIYEEMAGQEGTGGNDGPQGSTGDDGSNYNKTSYTQDELAKNYGVTLKKDQALVCDTIDNDGVLVTAYEGMEFYQADDADGMLMEYNDAADTYIVVYVYDTAMDAGFYEEYYGAKKLEGNLYWAEDDDTITLIAFEENITIEIDLETETEEIMEKLTGGDNQAFMKELYELCEIVPAA